MKKKKVAHSQVDLTIFDKINVKFTLQSAKRSSLNEEKWTVVEANYFLARVLQFRGQFFFRILGLGFITDKSGSVYKIPAYQIPVMCELHSDRLERTVSRECQRRQNQRVRPLVPIAIKQSVSVGKTGQLCLNHENVRSFLTECKVRTQVKYQGIVLVDCHVFVWSQLGLFMILLARTWQHDRQNMVAILSLQPQSGNVKYTVKRCKQSCFCYCCLQLFHKYYKGC